MQFTERRAASKPSRHLALAAVLVLAASAISHGQTTSPAETKSPSERAAAARLPEPKGAKRLAPDYEIWLDPKEKAVLIDGQISLREGMLEMFACIKNTKEHESIVSANTKAYLVHAALLTLGAEPGSPVRFRPEYAPPTGTEIDVLVRWKDEQGKDHEARAQDWIRDVESGEPMQVPFVFAGSSFWIDPESGKKYYMAEGGDFICVSNFTTAMLDIPIESSQANAHLAFEAFTERIPPLGAPVRLVLKPKLKKAKPENESPPAEQAPAEQPPANRSAE